MAKDKTGAVVVVGGGIGGMQASLDLADSGFYVYLIEKSSSIGGRMSQLDKTFPTNDCSMCIMSPKLVECGKHLNIEILTLAELESVTGEPGNFQVKLNQKPRYIDLDKCIACGTCSEKCPRKVDDEYNAGLIKRKAASIRYPQAVPLKYFIDADNCIYFEKGKCRACEKFCPADAVDFNQTEKEITLNAGAIILATGFQPY
ncbi:MAG: FAD-dependent oxidoreductase, partial [Thermodesulfobacteriota bacterium]|nr:FAD-dependent oxidoreductase [Thermodesulfobacteriota bacterium]